MGLLWSRSLKPDVSPADTPRRVRSHRRLPRRLYPVLRHRRPYFSPQPPQTPRTSQAVSRRNSPAVRRRPPYARRRGTLAWLFAGRPQPYYSVLPGYVVGHRPGTFYRIHQCGSGDEYFRTPAKDGGPASASKGYESGGFETACPVVVATGRTSVDGQSPRF